MKKQFQLSVPVFFSKKRIIFLLLTFLMIISFVPSVCANDSEVVAGLENFTKINTYKAGQFTDVASTAWYADSVAQVYELGLMNGNSATTFNPNGKITQAEALTITARIHKIYHTGNDDFSDIKQEMLSMTPAILAWCNNDKNSPAYKEFCEAWYAPYVYYLYTRVAREVDGEYPAFPALEWDSENAPYIDSQNPLIRLRFISAILYGALPESEYNQINIVDNGGIPDLSYANSDRIYKLYRAGILAGSDSSGTFAPYSDITRAEVAAILTRMIDPSLRKNITLRNTQSSSDVITVSSYDLTISETTTLDIDLVYEEKDYPDGITLNANYDSNMVEVEWGDWFLDSITLDIIPLQNGTTTISISIAENPDEYQDITVTVSGLNSVTSSVEDEEHKKYVVAACAMNFLYETAKFPNTVCIKNIYYTNDNGADNQLWLVEGYGENNFGGKSYAYVSAMVFSEPSSYPLGNYTNYELWDGSYVRTVAHNDNPYRYSMGIFTEKLDEEKLKEVYYQYFDEFSIQFE